MKLVNSNPKTTVLKLLTLLVLGLSAVVARATPYASGVTNDGVNVSFILNENADNVKVIFDGGGPGNTNDLATTRGILTFPLAGHTSFEIHVTKSTPEVWTQTSDDIAVNPLVGFFVPASLDVNKNPASPFFGRVYVLEHAETDNDSQVGGGRRVSKGVFALNADLSDALGQAGFTPNQGRNGGLTAHTLFTVGGNLFDPWSIKVGGDGYLYLGDAQNPRGALARMDGNLENGELVLAGVGNLAQTTVHTVVYGVHASGSLATSDLTVWGTDGQWGNTQPVTNKNVILRWDIGAGPLTNANPPVVVASLGSPTVERDSNLAIAPDGKIFGFVRRDVNDIGSVKVYSAAGALLWNSFNGTVDFLTNTVNLAISPDNTKLAVIRGDRRTWIMNLTNGIPDVSTTNILATFTTGTISTGRSVGWDAAGNLYVANRSTERLRVWSPGGSKTAITRSAGTFSLFAPSTVVSVTNTVPTVAEGSATGQFTIRRVGNTAVPLTVFYTTSGDAVSGSDYTALLGSVTIAPGAVSTNIPVSASVDGDTEFTETVTLEISLDPNYGLGTPSLATVQILDTATPQISITEDSASGALTNLLESFASSQAVFPLTRKGSLASATTVNVAYSGAAGRNTDYNAPLTITFAPGAVTTNLTLTPINDPLVEAPEPFTVVINSGSYNFGAVTSASGLVYSEDLSSANMTTIFADRFDTDTAGAWQVNKSDGDSDAAFGTNYGGALGIPEAPSSSGGFTATRGLVLRAHLGAAATTPGISVSPLNLTGAKGDFRFRFDLWMNYIGPLAIGGAGSTEHFTAGIATSGTSTIWPGGPGEGIWVTSATDGDVADTQANQADYGVFVGAGLQPASSGWYAAGIDANARGNGHVHYAPFGRSAAPSGQVTAFPTQTETVREGALGMAWHSVTLAKQGDSVTWDIDGYRIATVSVLGSGATLTSGNVFLGFNDWFSSACVTPNLEFALFDNVRVEVAQPLITDVQLINSGADVQITFTASTTDIGTSFDVQASENVIAGYLDLGAVVNPTANPGEFQAVIALPAPNARPTQQYYRIRRL